MKDKMIIGYIKRNNIELNPEKPKFELKESSYTRKISSRGDKIYSKMLVRPEDYDDVQSNTEIISSDGLVIVNEVFFMDENIKKKIERWIAWANCVNEKEYDIFQ